MFNKLNACPEYFGEFKTCLPAGRGSIRCLLLNVAFKYTKRIPCALAGKNARSDSFFLDFLLPFFIKKKGESKL